MALGPAPLGEGRVGSSACVYLLCFDLFCNEGAAVSPLNFGESFHICSGASSILHTVLCMNRRAQTPAKNKSDNGGRRASASERHPEGALPVYATTQCIRQPAIVAIHRVSVGSCAQHVRPTEPCCERPERPASAGDTERWSVRELWNVRRALEHCCQRPSTAPATWTLRDHPAPWPRFEASSTRARVVGPAATAAAAAADRPPAVRISRGRASPPRAAC